MTQSEPLRTAFAVAAGAAFLALAACGDAEEGTEIASTTIDNGDGTETDVSVRQTGDGQVYTYSSDDGEDMQVRTGGDVASRLPDWAPLYPGAKAQPGTGMGATFAGTEGDGAIITALTDDRPAEVLAWYKARAEGSGLKVETEMTMGEMSMFGAQDEAGRMLQVMATPEDGRTSVTVTAIENMAD